MEKLGTDTIMAIRTLKSLGGVNFDQLQEKNTGPRKCCCWGTPIGDKLLMLADDLDKDGNTLLAQTQTEDNPLTKIGSGIDKDKNLFSLVVALQNKAEEASEDKDNSSSKKDENDDKDNSVLKDKRAKRSLKNALNGKPQKKPGDQMAQLKSDLRKQNRMAAEFLQFPQEQ